MSKRVEKKTTKVNVSQARVMADSERRTCIEVSRMDGVVQYIPLETTGLDLLETSAQSFDARYKMHVTDHPADHAAKLYVRFAKELGASREAVNCLAHLTPISTQEANMAVARRNKLEEQKTTKPTKPTKVKAEKPAKVKAEKPAKVKAEKPAKVKKERGETAASMFRRLIMTGKLTDDKIFQQVQEKFGLDDSKRGYVTWYRNDLTKKGENPPTAKTK